MLRNDEQISEVFQENYPNLCRFLESIVGRGGHAQDIAQESFLRLCRTDREIAVAEIRFWLFRVARNLALNEISKNTTRIRLWDQIKSFFERTEPNAEEVLIRDENARIVRALLNRLPEHQRSALILREQEDMTYREIAMTLNISEDKVKIDIFRARRALRDMWHEGKKI